MSGSHKHCTHFEYALPRANANKSIKGIVTALQKKDFDAIAFCGLSGAAIACPVAYVMQKELILVRKKQGNDGSNSGMYVEGYVDATRIAIIDDFICGDGTMRNIVRGLHMHLRNQNFQIVAVALYDRPGRFDVNTPEYYQREYATEANLKEVNRYLQQVRDEDKAYRVVTEVINPTSTKVPLSSDPAGLYTSFMLPEDVIEK